ncbi:hypothetical protein [Streptomyces sp. NEAU-L66]|uniref:hypothetical protein n=1 Tax=Streptomyces sp. NEAU-L66 TaxID=3390812 RepID=UPI0039C668B3
MGELVPHPRPAAGEVRIVRVVMPVAVRVVMPVAGPVTVNVTVRSVIRVVVGGLLRVMGARGLLGLVPVRVRIALYVIRDMRMAMAVHVIMAVRVSAIVCHMAYRGTPIRLQLPP